MLSDHFAFTFREQRTRGGLITQDQESAAGKCNERDLPYHVRCKNRVMRYLGGRDLYLMKFWKVYVFFQNSQIPYEDKQYEENNLGEKMPHILRNLTCNISNFQLRVVYLPQFSMDFNNLHFKR